MFSHRAIWHGRRICHSRKPACGACPIARLCPSFGEGPTDPAGGGQAGASPRPRWWSRRLDERAGGRTRVRRDPRLAAAAGRQGVLARRLGPVPLPATRRRQRAGLGRPHGLRRDGGRPVGAADRAGRRTCASTPARSPSRAGRSTTPTRRSVAAALREANEEVGLDPATVLVIAELPAIFIPVSGFVVTPVLGWWQQPHEVWPVDTAEVARVELVPVVELADPANRFKVTHPSGWLGPGLRGRRPVRLGFHRRPARPVAGIRRVGPAVGRVRPAGAAGGCSGAAEPASEVAPVPCWACGSGACQ